MITVGFVDHGSGRSFPMHCDGLFASRNESGEGG
jgi:hypothetical protein